MGPIETAKRQVLDACRELLDAGYLAGTGGNISVRVIGQAAMGVTPSNLDYSQLSADEICVVDWSLQTITGTLRPSVESGMHSTVYQMRQDVGVIIHTHQPYASSLSLINKPIPALFDEQVRFLGRSVEIIPYAPSGTGFLKRNIARKLGSGNNAYILQNHGVLCFGPTVERAIFNVHLLEKCALTYLLALCSGESVNTIPLVIREIIVGKLRKDEAQTAEYFRKGEPLPDIRQKAY